MQIEEQIPLAPYTTLRIGGPARFFCHAATPEELLDAVAFARKRHVGIFVLGGGSNLLVSDAGFDGLVIHLQFNGPIVFIPDGDAVLCDVDAGTPWNDFVQEVCAVGLGGVECLAGIPGLTGGTPVQNVGAYGQEVAQTIVRVTVLDLETLHFEELGSEHCGFAYRTSIFNTTHRGRYIVTSVRFRLTPGARPNLTYADLKRHFGDDQPTLVETYDAVRQIRRSKGMLLVDEEPDSRSAGSFFKNPVVPLAALSAIAERLNMTEEAIPNWPAGGGRTKLPAAWLLDQAGFHRGYEMGHAGISSRHTLALINRTGLATCADICQLRDAIVAEVAARFGIQLEQEPVYLR
ncbi:UDP-N-acetylmuramate dehydrogenase [Granulicella rosea]|uniref:UDP-N-acetylenolpyruvoylglucosamine reductase n=1 Tax=Granulicella rosea TaxID=474952 RepID=A0A239H801_9BACT|nr:UDP-N-acetylmuramate dehydrogenase [Granulicella rosea]SNS77168.1 UDP-N-acetylmuramate dehydrogenase [Granulicella rosea]